MKSVLLEDGNDLYNRHLKRVLVAALLLWLVYTFLWSSHATHTDGAGRVVSFSRDGGLQMTLLEPIPLFFLRAHSFAGAALLGSVVLQKYFVLRMSEQSGYARWHRWNGYACLVMMAVMSFNGWVMGFWSSWDNFPAFSVGFAAPYAFWIVSILVTIYRRQYRWHRLFANQALKGCIVVPAARLVGGVVQRAAPHLGESLGYYYGIGVVVLVAAVWEISDIYNFVVQPCAGTALERKNRAKGRRG